jgi:hypothetical protein
MKMAVEIIPQQLQALFELMDFIASAKKGVKLCFKYKRHVSSNSWLGSIYRSWYSESQEARGNEIIRKCCEEAVQTYKQYKGSIFSSIIVERMVAMREGINNIKLTYENDASKVSVCINLGVSMTTLNMVLPPRTPELLPLLGHPQDIPPLDLSTPTLVD